MRIARFQGFRRDQNKKFVQCDVHHRTSPLWCDVFSLRLVLPLRKSIAMQATMQASLRVRCHHVVSLDHMTRLWIWLRCLHQDAKDAKALALGRLHDIRSLGRQRHENVEVKSLGKATKIVACHPLSHCHVWKSQPAPKYDTKGCSHIRWQFGGSANIVFAALQPGLAANFGRQWREHPRAILWRSPKIGLHVWLWRGFPSWSHNRITAQRWILGNAPQGQRHSVLL